MANPTLEALHADLVKRMDPQELWAEVQRLSNGYNLLGYVFECWTNRPDCVDWRAFERICDVIHRVEAGENVGLDEPWLSDPNGKDYPPIEYVWEKLEVIQPAPTNGGGEA